MASFASLDAAQWTRTPCDAGIAARATSPALCHVEPCRPIDLSCWPRARHFQTFRALPAGLTIPLIIDSERPPGNLFKTLLFSASAAANALPNFRYRLRDGVPIEFERVHPAWTVMDRHTGLFYFAKGKHTENFEAFCRMVDAASNEATAAKCLTNDRLDVVYFSSVPWRYVTAVTALHNPDGIPQIIWGRCEQVNARIELPVTVLGDHGFLDGLHICQFAEQMERLANATGLLPPEGSGPLATPDAECTTGCK